MEPKAEIKGGPVSHPGPGAIREELERILASRVFAQAARSRRFLSYVVERTLAGEANAVKESILGLEVFDRPGDFDPRADTIVRVEARKMRQRLQEYYEGEGSGSPFRIEVPKGSYVPEFHSVEREPPRPPSSGGTNRPARVIATFALAAVALGGYWRWRGSPLPEPPSVVVLPFVNLSSDPANEYFADGLTEDLTHALAAGGDLRVVSRTSAFLFKAKQADIREIGSRLHAAYAVEGSARKEGSRVKVTAQLIRTSDGYHLWSLALEKDLAEIFAVQSDIASAVTSALRGTFAGVPMAAKPRTANVRAFDLYLQAKHAARTGLLLDYGPVEERFRRSIAADPSYPLPYLGLAELYLKADIMQARPTRELVSLAKASVNQALSLDAGLAEAHVALASLSARHEYDWITAENHLRRALELDRHSASAHHVRATDVLALQGLWREAEEEERQARELDPLSFQIALSQPWLQCLQRNHDGCWAGARNLEAEHSRHPGVLILMAQASMGKGDYDGAIGALRQLAPSPIALAFTAACHAKAGRVREAREVLAQLNARSPRNHTAASDFAIVHLSLNDTAEAFRYLELARQDQESFLALARTDAIFDPIRPDLRFKSLLSALRLSDSDVQRYQTFATSVHR